MKVPKNVWIGIVIVFAIVFAGSMWFLSNQHPSKIDNFELMPKDFNREECLKNCAGMKECVDPSSPMCDEEKCAVCEQMCNPPGYMGDTKFFEGVPVDNANLPSGMMPTDEIPTEIIEGFGKSDLEKNTNTCKSWNQYGCSNGDQMCSLSAEIQAMSGNAPGLKSLEKYIPTTNNVGVFPGEYGVTSGFSYLNNCCNGKKESYEGPGMNDALGGNISPDTPSSSGPNTGIMDASVTPIPTSLAISSGATGASILSGILPPLGIQTAGTGASGPSGPMISEGPEYYPTIFAQMISRDVAYVQALQEATDYMNKSADFTYIPQEQISQYSKVIADQIFIDQFPKVAML